MFSSNYVDSSIPQTRQEWMEALQEDFNITGEDLEANRRGQLSDRQRAKIEPMVTYAAGNPNFFVALLGMILVVAAIIFVINIATGGMIALFLSVPEYRTGAAVVTVLFLLMLIPGGINTNRLRRSIDSMDKMIVQTAEGQVQKRGARRGFNTVSLFGNNYMRRGHRRNGARASQRGCEVSFGETRLYFSEAHAENFLEGAVYRVYYLPFANGVYLLSAELMQMP